MADGPIPGSHPPVPVNNLYTGPVRKFNELWNGFDKVYNRITSGRHDLKNMKQYLDERAQIEETYAKSLTKLANKPDFEAVGSLGQCWAALRDETTAEAQRHNAFATTLSKDISLILDKTMAKLKAEKTRMQKEHERLVAEVHKRTQNHERSQTRYRDAVRQCDTNIMNRDSGQKENLQAKAQKSLDDKAAKSVQLVDETHAAYEDSVKQLQDAQKSHDVKLREHLELFESLERERLAVLGEEFKALSDAVVHLRSGLEATIGVINRNINAITIEKDVQDFIVLNDPKQPAPEHVLYEPINSEFYNNEKGITGAPRNGSFHSKSNNNPAPPPGPAQTKVAPPSSPPPGPGAAGMVAKSPKNSAPPAEAKAAVYAVALYDFESEEAADLPFKAGDRIRVVDSSDPNWWKGELRGKEGTFPSNYVENPSSGGPSVSAASPAPAEPTVANAESYNKLEGHCEALYDFEAQGADELSFKAGEKLMVTGEVNGWYLGKSMDGNRVGIFPSNYVQMLT